MFNNLTGKIKIYQIWKCLLMDSINHRWILIHIRINCKSIETPIILKLLYHFSKVIVSKIKFLMIWNHRHNNLIKVVKYLIKQLSKN
jgi:hypothetical protein